MPGEGTSEPRRRREKYWDFDFPDWGEEDDPGSAPAIAEFEQTFARAIELRLRADVPVVGYLSGGVDSGLRACYRCSVSQVARCQVSPCVSQIPCSMRRSKPQRLSAPCGPPTVIEAGLDLIADTYASLIAAAESPVLDTSCAALLALSREVRAQGFKVVLTGEGADEGFAGYFWFKIRELARVFDIGDRFRPSTAASQSRANGQHQISPSLNSPTSTP